jgi:hypothetical protein
MGHCGEFGNALWATAVMGHCGVFGFALRATAWNEALKGQGHDFRIG